MTDLKNAETASKKWKHILEETKRDIIRQVLITAAPWIFSFQDFEQISFNRKQSKRIKKKSSLLTDLLKYFLFGSVFLLDPETLFFQTKPAERSFLSLFGDSDFRNRKCWNSE